VLAKIEDRDRPQPIKRTATRWADEKHLAKVRVEYFLETFRIGEEVRAHVSFSWPRMQWLLADELAISIRLTANEGKFQSRILLEGIPPQVASRGVYICRFRPWEPLPDSSEAVAQPGPAKISLTVLAKTRNEKTEDIIRTWETQRCEVTILPARQPTTGE